MFDFSSAAAEIEEICMGRIGGSVAEVRESTYRIAGLGAAARIGDGVELEVDDSSALAAQRIPGEIIGLESGFALAMSYRPIVGVSVGARVWLAPHCDPTPSDAWLGQVLDAFGRPVVGGPAPQAGPSAQLRRQPPRSLHRRPIGARLATGNAALDTLLPICAGQRIGIFAGSGIGKSRLLASLAQNVSADIVVIGLIGERGREVREFVENTLGAEAMKRAVVIVATSDEPAPMKRRAAWLSMAVAEYYRDQGRSVALLFDSVTRFAEAHREVALTGGETAGLSGFPPSTVGMIAGLAERAGPGGPSMGDITAIFTVLVAGSDMEEPVADMCRGILDGHLILDRGIAERGRFPSIDVRRSVSRSLPEAANEEENALIAKARAVFAAYERAEPMLQIGLYQKGADPALDEAIRIWPALDAFVGEESDGAETAFARLAEILASPTEAAAGKGPSDPARAPSA